MLYRKIIFVAIYIFTQPKFLLSQENSVKEFSIEDVVFLDSDTLMTKDPIIEIDSIIKYVHRKVTEYNFSFPHQGKITGKYKMQLLWKSDSMILVNCFCGELPSKNWKETYVDVSDGGKCYFECFYVVGEKKVFDFNIR